MRETVRGKRAGFLGWHSNCAVCGRQLTEVVTHVSDDGSVGEEIMPKVPTLPCPSCKTEQPIKLGDWVRGALGPLGQKFFQRLCAVCGKEVTCLVKVKGSTPMIVPKVQKPFFR